MRIKSIVDELNKLRITIKVQGGELKASGPGRAITEDIIGKIKANKEALIEYLQSTAGGTSVNHRMAATTLNGNEPLFDDAPCRPLSFSLFYFGNAETNDEQEKYKLLIEGAKYADANGYAAVWTPERHFNKFGGLYPSPSVLGAALSVITKNIAIRAGSVVLPLHNPLRIAEEWAVVDNLSGGRVGIACAPGWQANDFVLSPGAFENRHEIMYRYIQIIQKLWAGEKMSLDKGNGTLIDTQIYPLAIQKELPIWITSKGSIDTFISAGKLGFNILTHLLGETVEELAVKIQAYRKAYKENGHDIRRSKVVLMLHTYIGNDLQLVHEEARVPFINYLRTSLGLIKYDAKAMGFDLESGNLSSQDIEYILNYAFSRYVTHSSLIGTKESCLGMLQKISAIGVDEVAALIDFGIDSNAVMKSLVHLTEVKESYKEKSANYSFNDF